MKFGLKKETIEQINKIFAGYPQIKEVLIYGSRAKGNFKPGSDIDLVLKGESLDSSLVNKMKTEIDDLLLPYSFDIALLTEISNQELLDHIKRKGAVFYPDKDHK